jgi:nicotinamidase-related amidase
MTPQNRDLRYATMEVAHEGHALWRELDVRAEDGQVVKKRFSAFIDGSSHLLPYLRQRGIDTLLIAGTEAKDLSRVNTAFPRCACLTALPLGSVARRRSANPPAMIA